MIQTTTNVIDGRTVSEYLGVVTGEAILGANIVRDLFAGVRDIVGGFGADLVVDCSGHPSAGPEGIEFLRDGGTYVEMGQFTDAGSIETSWHRICTKDLNVLGSWGFTGNDLPHGRQHEFAVVVRREATDPAIEQLHCLGPGGNVARVSALAAGVV